MHPEKRKEYLEIAHTALMATQESSRRNKNILAEERVDYARDQIPLDVYSNYRNGNEYRQKLENLIKFLEKSGPTKIITNGSEVYLEILSDNEISFSGECLIYHPGKDPYQPFNSIPGLPPIFSSGSRVIKSILGKPANLDVYYLDPQDEKSKARICSIE